MSDFELLMVVLTVIGLILTAYVGGSCKIGLCADWFGFAG